MKEGHKDSPLSVRMRPQNIDEFSGQEHVLSPGKILRRSLEADRLSCLILWGPPGCGKTTLGEVISNHCGAEFVYLNASFTGAKELKKEAQLARQRLEIHDTKTIIFIDEIHRLNRLQQDYLIPDTETQFLTLIGATTANPFFYLNPALISRSLVCEFKPLSNENIIVLLKRALKDKERGLGNIKVKINDKTLNLIAEMSNGDARKSLNALEIAVTTTPKDSKGKIVIDEEVIHESMQTKPAFYDSKADYHYDVTSAFIKSIRGSDPDAALYWLGIMLKGGEDPRFIARRLIISASEDVGNADPFALSLATSCLQAVDFVGMPEARINLAQTTSYLAMAQKSNAAYLAIDEVLADIERNGQEDVPLHLKDAHYKSAKKLGRGLTYKYPHDFKGSYVKQKYRNNEKRYYFPKDQGREKIFKERLLERGFKIVKD